MPCSICGKSGHNRRSCGDKKISGGCSCCMSGRCSRGLKGGCMSCGGIKKAKISSIKGGAISDIVKIFKTYFKNLSSGALKEFMERSNKYRAKFCKGRSRPLLSGELHPDCQNFSGPGTRIDLPEVFNYPPYNDIDACSKQHDIDYMEAAKQSDPKMRRRLIREADERVLACYNRYKDQESYSAAFAGISAKVYLEDKFPLIAKLLIPSNYLGSNF